MVKIKKIFKAHILYSIAILWSLFSCNSELEDLEGTVNLDANNPAIGNLPCERLHLREVTNVPIAVSLGNEQKKPENENIIIDEVDRITTTQFFATHIWKDENTFDFSQTDYIVNYALQHRKQIHAHCLIYPLDDVNPGWLRSYPGNNEQFEQLIRHYITTIVGRYKGKVKSYDLTNELFAYSSSATEHSWLRDRFSSDEEFFDFIGRCFRYAHDADPNAILFYNDYGHEFSDGDFEKSRAIVAQIEKWKRDGVPVHGYGLQLHTSIYRPIEHIERALQMAVSTGLIVHISELDVAINWSSHDIEGRTPGDQGISYMSEELKQEQKATYKHIAEVYKKVVPRNQQYGITLWDLCDKYSWLNWNRFEAGTVFDDNYHRKPAFYGLMEGLADQKLECN